MLKLPNCDFCKHRIDNDKICCKAYPDGIPEEAMAKADISEECGNSYSFEEIEREYKAPLKDGFLNKLLDIIGS